MNNPHYSADDAPRSFGADLPDFPGETVIFASLGPAEEAGMWRWEVHYDENDIISVCWRKFLGPKTSDAAEVMAAFRQAMSDGTAIEPEDREEWVVWPE